MFSDIRIYVCTYAYFVFMVLAYFRLFIICFLVVPVVLVASFPFSFILLNVVMNSFPFLGQGDNIGN